MSEMYEFVQNSENKRKGKRRAEWKVAVLIAVAVAIILSIGGVLWWNISTGRRFSTMCGKLSDSTTYAYEHDSAAVEDHEGVYKLTEENLYELYQCVCVYGPGKQSLREPEGETLTVTYGNGASLRLIEVGEGLESELYFCYSDPDGYSHIFHTREASLSYLRGRYLSRAKNELKEG